MTYGNGDCRPQPGVLQVCSIDRYLEGGSLGGSRVNPGLVGLFGELGENLSHLGGVPGLEGLLLPLHLGRLRDMGAFVLGV